MKHGKKTEKKMTKKGRFWGVFDLLRGVNFFLLQKMKLVVHTLLIDDKLKIYIYSYKQIMQKGIGTVISVEKLC